MADILVDNQAVPATPAAGKTILFVNSGTKLLCSKDDAGKVQSLGGLIMNYNTADVVANAADTYLTGSGLSIPTGQVLQVGTTFTWRFGLTKTAAGTATPIWTVRIGTAGTTADTARLTFTGAAAAATAEAGWVEISAILRNVGASGVLAGVLVCRPHTNGIGASALQVTSAAFDTTVAGSIIGVSVNPGAAGVWTHQVIHSQMLNI